MNAQEWMAQHNTKQNTKTIIKEPKEKTRKHFKLGGKCRCGGKRIFIFYTWRCMNKMKEELEKVGLSLIELEK